MIMVLLVSQYCDRNFDRINYESGLSNISMNIHLHGQNKTYFLKGLNGLLEKI